MLWVYISDFGLVVANCSYYFSCCCQFQVNALLHSLDIDSDIQLNGLHPRYPELENLWNESQGVPFHQAPHSADKWVTEYNRFAPHGNSESWADSFQQQHGAHNWASEFERVSVL